MLDFVFIESRLYNYEKAHVSIIMLPFTDISMVLSLFFIIFFTFFYVFSQFHEFHVFYHAFLAKTIEQKYNSALNSNHWLPNCHSNCKTFPKYTIVFRRLVFLWPEEAPLILAQIRFRWRACSGVFELRCPFWWWLVLFSFSVFHFPNQVLLFAPFLLVFVWPTRCSRLNRYKWLWVEGSDGCKNAFELRDVWEVFNGWCAGKKLFGLKCDFWVKTRFL